MTVVYRSAEDLLAALDTVIGPTEWMTVEQARVDAFAGVTDDHQWIHVDPARAADGPFGGTIAHGMLTLALLPRFLTELRTVEGMRMGVNVGLDKVRFPAPVPVGSRVRATAGTTGVTVMPDGGVQVVNRMTVEIEDGAEPACVADLVSRYYF